MGAVSKELLYYVQYDDGTKEDLTMEEVEDSLVKEEAAHPPVSRESKEPKKRGRPRKKQPEIAEDTGGAQNAKPKRHEARDAKEASPLKEPGSPEVILPAHDASLEKESSSGIESVPKRSMKKVAQTEEGAALSMKEASPKPEQKPKR